MFVSPDRATFCNPEAPRAAKRLLRLHIVPEPQPGPDSPPLVPPAAPEIVPPEVDDPPGTGYPEPVREPGIPPSPISAALVQGRQSASRQFTSKGRSTSSRRVRS